MSTFETPTYFYVFQMDNGKQKLAYGASPEDALSILRYRLSAEEMSHVLADKFEKVPQRQIRKYIGNLG